MTASTTTASPWPVRAAYFSAAIFTAASGGTNLIYGWQKGGDLAGSLVWASVAAAVAAVFALSWAATIKSLEAKRWSAAVISLVALVLAGSYSVTAALGSASGGRTNAATVETATTDVRAKAQAAYAAAKYELDSLKRRLTLPVIEAAGRRVPGRQRANSQPVVLQSPKRLRPNRPAHGADPYGTRAERGHRMFSRNLSNIR